MLKSIIKKISLPVWLEIFLIIILTLRIPSLFEPFYYGDEMIYLTLGNAIKKGFVLYKEIHDNKPPLLYLLAALSNNVFWFRTILAFWSLVTIVFFWKLAEILFKQNVRAQKIATVVFGLLTTLPLLEGNIANAENFFIGPVIVGFLILLAQKPTHRNLFFAGTIFAIAALFKVPASFDAAAIFFFWIITEGSSGSKLQAIVKRTIYFGIGFITPIALSFIWYFFRGALNEYFVAAYLQNFGYISSWKPTVSLAIPVRVGVVGLGIIFLWFGRNKLSKPFIFASLWLLFSLFAATISERPYPHYLLQAAAPIAILAGFLGAARNVEQALVIIPLALAAAIPVYYKFYHYDTFAYYLRFIKFATAKINKQEYFGQFDSNVDRNYEIAKFVSQTTKPSDKIFVSGDTPSIYALSRRLPPTKYVADYHIRDFSSYEELIDTFAQKPPQLIIILPESNVIAFNKIVSMNYILIRTIKGAEIWKLTHAT